MKLILWFKALFCGENPRNMCRPFFPNVIGLDMKSASKADVSRQNFSLEPRDWYIDATIRCRGCGELFRFLADEQKAWYEDYGFNVWSFPHQCKACRRVIRDLKSIRREYDRDIAAALASDELDLKSRVASLVDQLCEVGEILPGKILENRRRLAAQIARRSRLVDPDRRLE